MGVEILKKQTDAERVIQLENALKLENQGRRCDNRFSDEQYKKLAMFTLEYCPSCVCGGDHSVGVAECQFYDETLKDSQPCELKRFLGID